MTELLIHCWKLWPAAVSQLAGNIESVREWITDGKNGLLCDPANPRSLAHAILRSLDDAELRKTARQHKLEIDF